MAKIPHEALHRIFRENPQLFTKTIRRVFSLDFPDIVEVSVIDTDLTETKAIERRADTILMAETVKGPQMLVIETQTSEDQQKVRSWAYYLSFLENKYGLPATLLVITPKLATAIWARGPLALGPVDRPSMRLFPFVCGPDNMPFITDRETAAVDVLFAVFAALTHRLDPDIEKVLDPLAAVLDSLDSETAAFWAEFTEGGLGEGCAKDSWRKIMTTMKYRYVSELRREGRAEGRAEGRLEGRLEGLSEGRAEGQAAALLVVIRGRGIELSEGDEARIARCQDTALLTQWLSRAATAETAAELFQD